MKKMHGDTTKRNLGLCILMATLLFGPAVAKADVVLDWNLIAVNTTNPSGPFAQARYVAIVQLAVFEAVNSITQGLSTISWDHRRAPWRFSRRSSHPGCLSGAHYLFPPANASTLGTARANSLALIPDGQPKSDGIATGDAAALAMIALRANDGSSPAQFKIPGPVVPGEWQATPSCPIVNGIGVGVFLQWGNVTPFGIPSVSEFLLDPPPALDSNQYAKAYNEVKTVGSASANSTERPQGSG